MKKAVKVLAIPDSEEKSLHDLLSGSWLLADFGLADDGNFYYLVTDNENFSKKFSIEEFLPDRISYTIAALINEDFSNVYSDEED